MKNKNLTLILILLPFFCSSSVFGQEFEFVKKTEKYVFKPKKGKLESDKSFDEVIDNSNGIWAVRNGEFWGFVNSDGKIIVEPKYEAVGRFNKNFSIVKRDNKYGVIDKEGREVEELIYEKIDYYAEGKGLAKKNGTWLILENGNAKETTDEIILKNPDVKPILKACFGEPEDCTLQKMLKAVVSSIQYPIEARQKRIEGTVVTEIVIDEKGNLDKVNILRSVGGGCDEESIRVIKANFTAWIPGKDGGEPVKSKIIFPFKYSLN